MDLQFTSEWSDESESMGNRWIDSIYRISPKANQVQHVGTDPAISKIKLLCLHISSQFMRGVNFKRIIKVCA